ncbi:MAG: hypothetical protein HY791_07065 [Deltaproteobacteria bacterium]|nr:hypothetical protein [Deltaproteobacteria bacterium]
MKSARFAPLLLFALVSCGDEKSVEVLETSLSFATFDPLTGCQFDPAPENPLFKMDLGGEAELRRPLLFENHGTQFFSTGGNFEQGVDCGSPPILGSFHLPNQFAPGLCVVASSTGTGVSVFSKESAFMDLPLVSKSLAIFLKAAIELSAAADACCRAFPEICRSIAPEDLALSGSCPEIGALRELVSTFPSSYLMDLEPFRAAAPLHGRYWDSVLEETGQPPVEHGAVGVFNAIFEFPFVERKYGVEFFGMRARLAICLNCGPVVGGVRQPQSPEPCRRGDDR